MSRLSSQPTASHGGKENPQDAKQQGCNRCRGFSGQVISSCRPTREPTALSAHVVDNELDSRVLSVEQGSALNIRSPVDPTAEKME